MLRTRVLTALVLAPLVLAIAWFGEPWLSLGVLLVVAVALIEATDLLLAGGWALHRVGTIAVGLLVGVTILVELNAVPTSIGWPVVYFGAGGLPVVALMMSVIALAAFALRHADPRIALESWMGSVLAVAWIGLLGPMLAAVGHLAPIGNTPGTPVGALGWASGTAWLLVLIGLVWSCDSGAYFVGGAIGRRKLHPQVSPAKTIEGYAGGILAAAVVTGILGWLLLDLAVPVAVALGAVTAAVAQYGDLAKSLLKRAADRKDSGRIFPGHGGMLDRIDSMLFAAPIVLTYAFIFAGVGLSP